MIVCIAEKPSVAREIANVLGADRLMAGYYEGKTCHRLAESTNFGIIQCGSIDGQGGADPAFSYGTVENAPADNMYKAGTIRMALTRGNGSSKEIGREHVSTHMT